ncbi:hypothetical protein D3C76_1125010 [compost metagenome]
MCFIQRQLAMSVGVVRSLQVNRVITNLDTGQYIRLQFFALCNPDGGKEQFAAPASQGVKCLVVPLALVMSYCIK